MDLLQGLARKQNATLILSMHDLPLAKRYCTRILGLKDGRITFDSTPEQLNDSAVADVLGRHIAG
jgi:phosphonate transport system ATP-binding protein